MNADRCPACEAVIEPDGGNRRGFGMCIECGHIFFDDGKQYRNLTADEKIILRGRPFAEKMRLHQQEIVSKFWG